MKITKNKIEFEIIHLSKCVFGVISGDRATIANFDKEKKLLVFEKNEYSIPLFDIAGLKLEKKQCDEIEQCIEETQNIAGVKKFINKINLKYPTGKGSTERMRWESYIEIILKMFSNVYLKIPARNEKPYIWGLYLLITSYVQEESMDDERVDIKYETFSRLIDLVKSSEFS